MIGNQVDASYSLSSKRRLGPTAERCTEAINSGYHNSTTTGYSEFVEALSMQLYEVLYEGTRWWSLTTPFMNRSANAGKRCS
jgi:hypothetical protein